MIIGKVRNNDVANSRIYVGDPKIVQDTYIKVGQNPLSDALKEVEEHIERPEVQGTHDLFMHDPRIGKPAIIQIPESHGRDFLVHPSIAKLLRTLHTDFGQTEVTSVSLPPKLGEYFPEVAKWFGISRTEEMPQVKEALGAALTYCEKLKHGFSRDTVLPAVINTIAKHL